MRETFLTFGGPEITEDDLQAVMETFRTGWIGTGPKALAFEQAFAEYKGTAHAAALSSCTAALHLAMLTAGVRPGDEVITSPVTFCATANAIVHAGAIPVFADVDPLTGLLDPREVEKRITPKTRAILPVHLAGGPCDMPTFCDLAASRLLLIEDCAHAVETQLHGQHAGTWGQAGCFSFYVTKNVVGIEGGMLITNDEATIKRVKTLALNGLSADAWSRFSDPGFKHYQAVEAGYKYNLPDVHAALALTQLQRVESNWQKREAIWRRYDQAFAPLPCFTPPAPAPDTRHARHLYTLLLDLDALTLTRDGFLQQLHRRNIGGGVHYISLHLHDYYRKRFRFTPESLPNALWHSERTVSLPLSPKMSPQDVDDVIEAVVDILGAYRR